MVRHRNQLENKQIEKMKRSLTKEIINLVGLGFLAFSGAISPAQEAPGEKDHVISGKSLDLTLRQEMKTREYGEAERKKDYYSFYWKHPDGSIVEAQLELVEPDVGWEGVQKIAETWHQKWTAEVAIPSEFQPDKDLFVSRPAMAPISKGPFRGLWMTHKKEVRKSGEKLIKTYYILWDKKDCWYAIFEGGESERKKFNSILDNAKALTVE
jgi:hypothetical protein